MAISGEIPLLPLTRLLSAWRVTPSTLAPSVTESSSASRQSWRTCRPGWGGFFIGIGHSPLVVVHKIDIAGVAFLEAKDHPPVPAHHHRQDALAVPGHGVQAKARHIHVLGFARGIEPCQNALDLPHQIGANAAAIALLKKPLQPAMP